MKIYFLIVACLLLIAAGVEGAEFTYSAGRYPNTETCTDTPTIDFPAAVTISKEYLAVMHCPVPADFNSGDFVSVWVEDKEGSPIFSLSEYVETDSGVVWTAPLGDSVGQAWKHLHVDPALFDCNTTGIPYSIEVNWDGQTASQVFGVYCPILAVTYFKDEVPYVEGFTVDIEVTDYIGNRMKGIPCSSQILYVSDMNNISIRQKTEIVETDLRGHAEFNYAPGFTSAMYLYYDYNAVIECLGGIAEFNFTVVSPDSQSIRNPVYYLMAWIADNWIPVIFAMLLASFAIYMLYLVMKKNNE